MKRLEASAGHQDSPTDIKDRTNLEARTAEEWAEIEAKAHDAEYTGAFPFGLRHGYEFTVDHVIWWEDYCYKKGRHDAGHRSRKFLELVDLASLEGKSVLDIGCGVGGYAVLCAKLGARATGIELSKVGIETAKKVAAANNVSERCTFIAGDFTKIDLPDEEFDIVLLHAVLHHLIKYPDVKEKIKRITKSGGKIVIEEGVQGANIIHYFRKLYKKYKSFRDPSQYAYEQDHGDVQLTMEVLKDFAVEFSKQETYLMSFFYMVYRVLHKMRDKMSVRLMLRSAKYMDDIVLTLAPSLRQRCGDVVMLIQK